MKQAAILLVLALPVAWPAMAQDEPVAESVVAEDAAATEAATTGDAERASPLDDLAWMVGTWVDEGENSQITTTCSWRMNRKFLTRSFRVTIEDQITLTGNQVIGWDPIAGQIRSWTFDSEGGIGEGRWIRDGNRWLVKKSFVLASGERASAINIITYVDQDTLRWQSTNREVAGELQPNISEVTVVRQQNEDTESKQGEEKEVSQ